MKKIIIILGLLLVLTILFGCTDSPKACTKEAKLCPDGSAVGRTLPNCEFAQCPVIDVNLSNNFECVNENGLKLCVNQIDTNFVNVTLTSAEEVKVCKYSINSFVVEKKVDASAKPSGWEIVYDPFKMTCGSQDKNCVYTESIGWWCMKESSQISKKLSVDVNLPINFFSDSNLEYRIRSYSLNIAKEVLVKK
ncbi:MAG: hypothetical protein NTY48_02425 [Candidatus Diapherotrites archaeon]|nr:hypothetical protein [Candidatus Diapherotrites archaeon]